MKKLFILSLLISVFLFRAEAKEFLSVYQVFFNPPVSSEQAGGSMTTLAGQVLYKFSRVNYYRVVKDKETSDIKITLGLSNYVNETNFIFTASLETAAKNKLEYVVHSKKDYESLTETFMNDFQLLFPLRGVVLDKQGSRLRVNIGRNYHVAKGSLFFILQDDFLSGVAIVDKVFNQYSELIITSYNSVIEADAVVIPFTYELNRQYRLNKDIHDYSSGKKEQVLKGLYGNGFRIASSIGNYIFISDEKEMGVFQNKRNEYERIEDLNFNSLKKCEFILNERYMGYILDSGSFKVMKMEEGKKFILKRDTEGSNYHLVNEKEQNLFPYEDVRVQDFSFYKDDSIIFYDKDRQGLYRMNLETEEAGNLVWTNTRAVLELKVTPNNKKLIVTQTSNYVTVYDLEDPGSFSLRTGPAGFLLTKTGCYLVFSKAQEIHFFNLYNQEDKVYSFPETFSTLALSFSEQYLLFYHPGQLNVYDLKKQIKSVDVFNKNKPKYIGKIEPLDDDSFLLYGKLFDLDRNNKLDYRDLNSLVRFYLSPPSLEKLLTGMDDFYGMSLYKQYVIYRKTRSLILKSIGHEEKSK